MAPVASKIPLTSSINTSCIDYVHPWTDSCLQGIAGLYLYCIFDSLRIYSTVYTLTLLTKGRIPTKDDIKKTVLGILQSTAFLSGTGFGYSLFLCFLRKLLGNFNVLTVSAIPAFLSSVFSILIERPSRRTLLCLYVSNVATETLWNMARSRGFVRNIKYGDACIFSASMALLLYYYRAGQHKSEPKSDSMFGVLRFVVGPYEEHGYTVRSSQANTFYRQVQVQNDGSSGAAAVATSSRQRHNSGGGSRTSLPPTAKTRLLYIVRQCLRIYKRVVYRIKCCNRHYACPHPFSCLYYSMQGASKMFTIGLGIQVVLKLVLNARKMINSPRNARTILLTRDTLNLASFLGAFAGLFRGVLCVMRRCSGKDEPCYALAAGLIAGAAFVRYPDNTVALYVLWKAAQITYQLGIDRGLVPRVFGFTEFLYCFSTAVLFHAAILEPMNLRPSYWKFLHSISGGRIACMNRQPLDAWGLNTSKSLEQVLKLTRTKRQTRIIFL